MDRLSSLLRVEAESKSPFPYPWDDVLLQHVHLWGDASRGEFPPEECEKSFDIRLWIGCRKVRKLLVLFVYLLKLTQLSYIYILHLGCLVI